MAAAWELLLEKRSPARSSRAQERKLPLIIVSASGGARMMEGAVSLMQMAKISSALVKLVQARIPYLSILTDPTTGGVTASYAMLGDLNLAEPGALIGFAGPRVIEQTIRQKLPKGFQRAEFLVEHGMIDALVPRPEMKDFLARALDFFLRPGAMTYLEAVRYLLSLLGDIRGSEFRATADGTPDGTAGPAAAIFPDGPHSGNQRQGLDSGLYRIGPAACGKTTGLYTSPHLARFNERLRLNGAEVSDRGFTAAVGEVRAANEWLVSREGPQAHPTFFESVTAAAFCGFRNARVDWGIVEVGLGGRLDATNVVDPVLEVMTPVDLDHERFLGKGKAAIAAREGGHPQAGQPSGSGSTAPSLGRDRAARQAAWSGADSHRSRLAGAEPVRAAGLLPL